MSCEELLQGAPELGTAWHQILVVYLLLPALVLVISKQTPLVRVITGGGGVSEDEDDEGVGFLVMGLGCFRPWWGTPRASSSCSTILAEPMAWALARAEAFRQAVSKGGRRRLKGAWGVDRAGGREDLVERGRLGIACWGRSNPQ